MQSTPHEFLVNLFRRCGDIAPELLRACADIDVAHDHIEVTSIDFSQVASTEYRADAVIELRNHDNATVAAVIVEVQLGNDQDKPYTWPVYVTTLRARQRCPVMLLVFTEDAAVARWARRPISIGHPGFCLEPVVIALDAVPRIIDREYALKLPELAVLSAMAHSDLDVLMAAISAIAPLPDDVSRLYLDMIVARWPAMARLLQEAQMQDNPYRSEFARKYYGQGHEEGLEKGHQRGLQEGRQEGHRSGLEEGRTQGLRDAVLALARTRLDAVTDEDRTAIAALDDHQALTFLISALGQAQGPDEARGALDLVVGGS
jgi:hypothetical protein